MIATKILDWSLVSVNSLVLYTDCMNSWTLISIFVYCFLFISSAYLDKLMNLTERVARGDSGVQLPLLPETPATMTSQLDRELVSDVKERYRTRFSWADATAVPEPLASPSTSTLPMQNFTSPSTSAQPIPDLEFQATPSVLGGSTSILTGRSFSSPLPSTSVLQYTTPHLKATSMPTTRKIVVTSKRKQPTRHPVKKGRYLILIKWKRNKSQHVLSKLYSAFYSLVMKHFCCHFYSFRYTHTHTYIHQCMATIYNSLNCDVYPNFMHWLDLILAIVTISGRRKFCCWLPCVCSLHEEGSNGTIFDSSLQHCFFRDQWMCRQ